MAYLEKNDFFAITELCRNIVDFSDNGNKEIPPDLSEIFNFSFIYHATTAISALSLIIQNFSIERIEPLRAEFLRREKIRAALRNEEDDEKIIQYKKESKS